LTYERRHYYGGALHAANADRLKLTRYGKEHPMPDANRFQTDFGDPIGNSNRGDTGADEMSHPDETTEGEMGGSVETGLRFVLVEPTDEPTVLNDWIEAARIGKGSLETGPDLAAGEQALEDGRGSATSDRGWRQEHGDDNDSVDHEGFEDSIDI
jgi:hypothetical protein